MPLGMIGLGRMGGNMVRRLTASLYERFSSRGEADFQNKRLSAMRFQFGGHHEKPAKQEASMSTVRSDALVFFSATGDLAYKKIVPSLHAMLKRGHLDVPLSAWPGQAGPCRPCCPCASVRSWDSPRR